MKCGHNQCFFCLSCHVCDKRIEKREKFENEDGADEVAPYIECPSYPLSDEFYK